MLFLLIGTYCYAGEKKYTVDSPDGKIQLAIIQTDAGELTYQLSVKRKQVIDASALGFKTEDGLTFPFRGWKMGKVTRNKVNSVWKPLWGKRAVVPDKYNEMKLSFVNEAKSSDALEVVARAYNEGVAFRYVSPQDAGSALELTTFNFAGDYTAWFYNGERHNIGPERLTETDGERLPVMTVKAADDLYLAVHEACLDEGEPKVGKRAMFVFCVCKAAFASCGVSIGMACGSLRQSSGRSGRFSSLGIIESGTFRRL